MKLVLMPGDSVQVAFDEASDPGLQISYSDTCIEITRAMLDGSRRVVMLEDFQPNLFEDEKINLRAV